MSGLLARWLLVLGCALAGMQAHAMGVMLVATPLAYTFEPGEEFEFVLSVNGPEGQGAGFGADPFGFSGTNAADFEVLSDTCAGTEVPVDGTCTVRVRYTGDGTSAGDNTLDAICSEVVIAGDLIGPILTCNDVEGPLAALFTRMAAIAVPVMTPLGMTLMALLMLGFFFYQGLRRSR